VAALEGSANRRITIDFPQHGSRCTDEAEVIDLFEEMKRGHRELGLYSGLTFVPEAVYRNMAST
jgi:hypothetical protein